MGHYTKKIPENDGYYWVRNEGTFENYDNSMPYIVLLLDGKVHYHDVDFNEPQVDVKFTALQWGARIYADKASER